MQYFYHGKTKGAITIFLIIILVPTMLFSAVLIDGSRMASARAMSQEAADLAAASALASYNQYLKDRYGLFAVDDSGSLEELYQTSLSATLLASGLSEQTYSDRIWELFKAAVTGQESPYNGKPFLNLYDFSVDSCNVTPLYSLANQEVLENQMIEHAKYRGVYLMIDRLDILNGLDGVKEQVGKNKETAEVMQQKMSVDEANAEADRAFVELCSQTETLNASVEALRTSQADYFASLSEEMEAVKQENIDGGNGKAHDPDYSANRENLKLHAEASVSNAVAVLEQAETAKTEVKEARERLEDFIAENSGKAADNEDIKCLIDDARATITDYEQYYTPRIDTLSKDTVLAELKEDHSLGADLSSSMDGIHIAFTKYAEEIAQMRREAEEAAAAAAAAGEEEEPLVITEYYYYFLDSDGKTEDAGEVQNHSYRPEITERIDYFQAVSWDDSNPMLEKMEQEGSGEKKIDKEFAKEQSGKSEPEEDDSGAPRGEVPEEIYQSRPSKTFGQNGEEIHQNTDFYDETGNLENARKMLNSGENSFLQDVAEGTRDDILCLTYMFGTFKTRLTGKFISEPDTDTGKKYVPEWRYQHEGGEINLRFEPKKDQETVLRGEIEYLIFGNRTDKANENSVYALIFAERLTNNIIALNTNDTVKNACRAAAAAACAATLGAVPETVFYWIFLSAWSIAETTLDMRYLIDYGYKIPLLKNKDNVLLDISPSDEGAGLVSKYGNPERPGKSILFVCYEDYLLLLLMAKGGTTRAMRTADLVEMNMRQEQEDFTMAQAYTYLKADTDISLRYMFGSTAPFQAEYERKGFTGRMRFRNTIYQGY